MKAVLCVALWTALLRMHCASDLNNLILYGLRPKTEVAFPVDSATIPVPGLKQPGTPEPNRGDAMAVMPNGPTAFAR